MRWTGLHYAQLWFWAASVFRYSHAFGLTLATLQTTPSFVPRLSVLKIHWRACWMFLCFLSDLCKSCNIVCKPAFRISVSDCAKTKVFPSTSMLDANISIACSRYSAIVLFVDSHLWLEIETLYNRGSLFRDLHVLPMRVALYRG
jgi:hypothetical protein